MKSVDMTLYCQCGHTKDRHPNYGTPDPEYSQACKEKGCGCKQFSEITMDTGALERVIAQLTRVEYFTPTVQVELVRGALDRNGKPVQASSGQYSLFVPSDGTTLIIEPYVAIWLQNQHWGTGYRKGVSTALSLLNVCLTKRRNYAGYLKSMGK